MNDSLDSGAESCNPTNEGSFNVDYAIQLMSFGVCRICVGRVNDLPELL